MAPSVVLFLRSSETIPRPFEKALPATPKKTKRVCHCGVSRRPTGREAALRQQTETATPQRQHPRGYLKLQFFTARIFNPERWKKRCFVIIFRTKFWALNFLKEKKSRTLSPICAQH